jgi:hypothetical protein
MDVRGKVVEQPVWMRRPQNRGTKQPWNRNDLKRLEVNNGRALLVSPSRFAALFAALVLHHSPLTDAEQLKKETNPH